MDINLTLDAHDGVRVFVNGALACEIAVGMTDTRDRLAADVHAARYAVAGMVLLSRALDRVEDIHHREDHVNTTADAKRAAYLRGLFDGVRVRQEPHPMPGLPGIRPEQSPSYEEGYDTGEAIARCAKRGVISEAA